MRFIVDAQLPPALAHMLCEAGHDATHTSAMGLLTGSDTEIWQSAASSGSVILTKDSDFVHLRMARRAGPQIVWVRSGNMGNAALLALCRLSLAKAIAELHAGAAVVEITAAS